LQSDKQFEYYTRIRL